MIPLIGLEILALILVAAQAAGGVRTDEAKYLLNIPYPHPPLARYALNLLDWLPVQEMFWRVTMATLVIQAVWIVWDMGRRLDLQPRFFLAASWVLAAAVLLQAGTIMMAPLTAVQGLVLIWWWAREGDGGERLESSGSVVRWLEKRRLAFALKPEWRALGVGMFWLASLFTAYQAVVFLPVVISLLRRIGAPGWQRVLSCLGPLVLLAAYTLTNPLIGASILIHGEDGGDLSLLERLRGVSLLWLVGGSALGSVLGTWGIARSRSWPLILSFLLLTAFLLGSVPYPYYAVLFTPLLVAGMREALHSKTSLAAKPLLPAFIAASLVVVFLFPPSFSPSPARAAMQAVIARGREGDIFITQDFGHEWQYESPFIVRHFRRQLLEAAQAVVCQRHCDDLGFDWQLLPVAGVTLPEVWVRSDRGAPESAPAETAQPPGPRVNVNAAGKVNVKGVTDGQ